MITQEVNQVRFGQYAAEVLMEMSELLLKEQSAIAQIYLYKTGNLAETLVSRINSALSTNDSASLIIKYPDYIRFLDLKKSRSGKKKKVYHPIYNRPLYGYVYGYAFKRLRAGLNSNIREAMAVNDILTINVSV